MTGEWMRQHNEQLNDLDWSLNIIRLINNGVGGACGMYGGSGEVRTGFWWGN